MLAAERLAGGEVQDRRGGIAVERDDRALEATDEHVELRSQEGCVAASGERSERKVREHLGGRCLRRLARPAEALAQDAASPRRGCADARAPP